MAFKYRTTWGWDNFWPFEYSGGSEIRPSLDFEWSKRGCVANGLDFEWDLKSGIPTIWNPDKWRPFRQKLFEIQTKSPNFEWSGFWMVGTIAIAKAGPFENRTIWKPDHLKTGPFEIWPSKSLDFKCFRILNGRISDSHCPWFQKPNTYLGSKLFWDDFEFLDVSLKSGSDPDYAGDGLSQTLIQSLHLLNQTEPKNMSNQVFDYCKQYID